MPGVSWNVPALSLTVKGVIKTKGLQNFKDARNYTMGELENERISRIASDCSDRRCVMGTDRKSVV